MRDKLIRREPYSFWADTWHVMLIGTLFLLLLVLAGPIQREVMRAFFLEVKSIHIPDHAIGDNPKIKVYRKIRRDFLGSFGSTIRDAETDRVACLTNWPEYFPYMEAAGRVDPWRGTLRGWIGNVDQLEKCRAAGEFGPGRYYLQTCHRISIFGPFVLRRCQMSNVFERYEPAGKVEGGAK